MNIAFYLSALMLGFLGSFHCAGMCGPLVLMLPKSNGSKSEVIAGRLIYNSGRVVTYIIIGILFGLLGLAVALKGFQKELSIATGIIILISIILSSVTSSRLKILNGSDVFTNYIRKNLKKLYSIKSNSSLFLIGVLNGLLPCGFVYLAIAGAASSGSVAGGMMYMALFGLGTFPMMMTISLAANYIGLKFRKIFSKISTAVVVALAILLIFRGATFKKENCCCKKELSAFELSK